MAFTPNERGPLFAHGATSPLRLVIYLAAAITLMVTDHRGGYLDAARARLSLLAGPLHALASTPAKLTRAAATALADRQQLNQENEALRKALLLAQARLTRLDALQTQNQRLRELLGARGGHSLTVQLAELVNIDLDPFRQRILLDVGEAQGVRVGQAVIDAHGVIGQVTQVLADTTLVILITDPDHALPVRVDRTGQRLIAYGTGDSHSLHLPSIPVSADLAVGDRLVTSGLGGRFPPGLPVGEIISVGSDRSGMFAEARARPAALMERSGEVLLLGIAPEPMGPPSPAPDIGPPLETAGEDAVETAP